MTLCIITKCSVNYYLDSYRYCVHARYTTAVIASRNSTDQRKRKSPNALDGLLAYRRTGSVECSSSYLMLTMVECVVPMCRHKQGSPHEYCM